MEWSINFQLVPESCSCCGTTFDVSRGEVLGDGDAVGLYLVAMHGCGARLAFYAIALSPKFTGSSIKTCKIKGWSTANEIQMQFTDSDDSPWKNEDYLLPILSKVQARKSEFASTFKAIFDRISTQHPVGCYFDGEVNNCAHPSSRILGTDYV